MTKISGLTASSVTYVNGFALCPDVRDYVILFHQELLELLLPGHAVVFQAVILADQLADAVVLRHVPTLSQQF